MALTYNGTTIGKIVVEQEHERYNLEIRQGNCLAVIIYVRKATPEELEKNPRGKWYHQLVTFFVNETHIKNIMSDGDPILDPMSKVMCHYKEPKKK